MVKRRVNSPEQSGKSRNNCCNKIKASKHRGPYQPHTASGLYILCSLAKGRKKLLFLTPQAFDSIPSEVCIFYVIKRQP